MNEYSTTDWYRIALEQLTGVALAVQRQDELDLEALSALATGIADALKKTDQLLVQAMSGPAGPPLITNLVNVAILATKVGTGLGYHGKELEQLTFAGLLHDIGLFAVPQSVITKSSRLTQDERTLIEQHPELGYEAVRKAGPKYDWLAQVVRQAHERWNGQGYPNKLKGRQISEYAQIIGVVDVFDALVSPRGYRRRFFPHETVVGLPTWYLGTIDHWRSRVCHARQYALSTSPCRVDRGGCGSWPGGAAARSEPHPTRINHRNTGASRRCTRSVSSG